jgi:hypothetical protein
MTMIDDDGTRQGAPPSAQDGETSLTHAKQTAIAAGVVLAGIVVLSAVTAERPTGSERHRAAIEDVADRCTHARIADVWTRTRLGNFAPMQAIKQSFPLPARTRPRRR